MVREPIHFPSAFFEIVGGERYRISFRLQRLLTTSFGLSTEPMATTLWTTKAGNPAFHAIRPSADAITFWGQVTCQEKKVLHYSPIDWFNLIVHEQVHLEQEFLLGRWQFYHQYIMQYLQYGYHNHPLEQIAYQYGCSNNSLASRFWRTTLPHSSQPISTWLLDLATIDSEEYQLLLVEAQQFKQTNPMPDILGRFSRKT